MADRSARLQCARNPVCDKDDPRTFNEITPNHVSSTADLAGTLESQCPTCHSEVDRDYSKQIFPEMLHGSGRATYARLWISSRLTSYSNLQLGRQSSQLAINRVSPPGSERNESGMIWGRGVHAKRHESGMRAGFCGVLMVNTNVDPCRLTVAPNYVVRYDGRTSQVLVALLARSLLHQYMLCCSR